MPAPTVKPRAEGGLLLVAKALWLVEPTNQFTDVAYGIEIHFVAEGQESDGKLTPQVVATASRRASLEQVFVDGADAEAMRTRWQAVRKFSHNSLDRG